MFSFYKCLIKTLLDNIKKMIFAIFLKQVTTKNKAGSLFLSIFVMIRFPCLSYNLTMGE